MIKAYFAEYKAFPYPSIEDIKAEVDFVGFNEVATILKIKDSSFEEGWNDGKHHYIYLTSNGERSVLRDKEGCIRTFRTTESLNEFIHQHLDIVETYQTNVINFPNS